MTKSSKTKEERKSRLDRIFGQVNRTAFFICLFISIGLIIGAFFVPPMAVIDGSVVAAVGELFGFSALGVVLDGIERGRKVSLSKGSTTIDINKDTDIQD